MPNPWATRCRPNRGKIKCHWAKATAVRDVTGPSLMNFELYPQTTCRAGVSKTLQAFGTDSNADASGQTSNDLLSIGHEDGQRFIRHRVSATAT